LLSAALRCAVAPKQQNHDRHHKAVSRIIDASEDHLRQQLVAVSSLNADRI
jgi:hypothetical protein